MSSRTRSVVWRYFSKRSAKDAICNTCDEIVLTSGNTSNLFKHLRSKHPSCYKDIELERDTARRNKEKDSASTSSAQPTLPQSVERFQPYSKESPRCKKLDTALLKMISIDIQPISIVEDQGFIDFVKVLDPRYQLPSRRTIMRSMLPEMYEIFKTKLKEEIAKASYCALTSDIWTSRQTLSYLTVTCHFIDTMWQLRSFVLSTSHLEVDHTAENIADLLKQIVEEWGISDKILAIITDNASNIVAAVRLLGWKHIPCFAHTLNLVVTDSLASDPCLPDIQKKCRDIVTYFHRSCKALERLTSIQTRLSLDNHKLIQEVVTRWNSTYYMFERIVEQNEAITTTLCLLNRSEMCLSANDLTKIKDAISLLQPFEAATRELSSEKYISLSKIIPIARSLQQVTNASSNSSLQLGQNLISQMSRRFLNIESNTLLAAACILDPRFKKVAFSDAVALEAITRRILSEMAGSLSVTPEPEESTGRPETQNPLWKQFDRRVNESVSRSASVDSTLEKQQYLQHRNVDRHEDPLKWWSDNASHLPLLQGLARKYLCIPGTSVPSERVFSKAGEIVQARRSSLKPENVNMILFLNKNM